MPHTSHARNNRTAHGLICLAVALAIAVLPRCALAQDAAQDLAATIEKANAYIEFSKDTERAAESWERYISWVNLKTGPTGKERYISYGLYDVSDLSGQIAQVREATQVAPSVPLDKTMLNYLAAYEALAPVLNRAAAYYDSNGFKADNVAEGKALHTQLVPLAKTFMAEREAMMPALRAFVRDVEGLHVAAVEKAEGRTARWQAAHIIHAADAVFDAFPRTRPQPMNTEELDERIKALGPDTPPEKFEEIMAGATAPPNQVIDAKRFSEAVEAYAKAVDVFDGFKGEKPDDFDDLKPLPHRLLELFRAFEKPLRKSQGRPFDDGGRMAGTMYQLYIELLNSGSSLAASPIRWLP